MTLKTKLYIMMDHQIVFTSYTKVDLRGKQWIVTGLDVSNFRDHIVKLKDIHSVDYHVRYWLDSIENRDISIEYRTILDSLLMQLIGEDIVS